MAKTYAFTDKIAQEIFEWVAGGNTLRAYCRQEGKPAKSVVYRWIQANREFRDPEGRPAKFADAMDLARQLGADEIAEETLEIIDTEAERISSQRGRGDNATYTESRDAAHVAWLKNRVWHRMQLLAKWHPKKYGEKVDVSGKVEHQHEFAASFARAMGAVASTEDGASVGPTQH